MPISFVWVEVSDFGPAAPHTGGYGGGCPARWAGGTNNWILHRGPQYDPSYAAPRYYVK